MRIYVHGKNGLHVRLKNILGSVSFRSSSIDNDVLYEMS